LAEEQLNLKFLPDFHEFLMEIGPIDIVQVQLRNHLRLFSHLSKVLQVWLAFESGLRTQKRREWFVVALFKGILELRRSY